MDDSLEGGSIERSAGHGRLGLENVGIPPRCLRWDLFRSGWRSYGSHALAVGSVGDVCGLVVLAMSGGVVEGYDGDDDCQKAD